MDDHTIEQLASAFRKVLGEDESGNRAILIKRIPIICNDVMQIKADLQWIKWLVMGVVGGIGILVITFLAK